MQPSKYQEAIVEWLRFGKGHACINAAAGAGKTSTIKMGLQALADDGVSPRDVKVLVFGKANATQMANSFPYQWNRSIATLHSTGLSMLRSHLEIRSTRGLIQADKYKRVCKSLGLIQRGELIEALQGAIGGYGDLLRLVDLVRLTKVEPKDSTIKSICNHFDIDSVHDFEKVAQVLSLILKEGERLAMKRESLDFTDMIWLPSWWNLGGEKKFNHYKFVLVDECQDLNASQLELVMILAGHHGRMMFVGDPRQAIMGFAGADANSYQEILERVRGKELPLSVCYRCPTSHIELVNHIFPGIAIEPAPAAEEGKIDVIPESGIEKADLSEKDLILSRKTAPLVNLCIKLIASGVPAIVKGRAIGESLNKMLKEIDRLGLPFDRFPHAVDMYLAAKIDRLASTESPGRRIELLKDKIAAIRAVYRALPSARNIQALRDYINGLFSDNSNGRVTLCTCHRAKGLEADRIFIYKPQDMPMSWRTIRPWQEVQEDNLLYVALTRSKSELVIVGTPRWLPNDKGEGEKENTDLAIVSA